MTRPHCRSIMDYSVRFILVALLVTGMPAACTPTGSPPQGDDIVDGDVGGSPVIRGTLKLADAAPAGQRAPTPSGRDVNFDATEGCIVVAVSNQTQRVYRGVVAADGSFEIDIPDAESGNTFILTILGPDGKPLGPVLLAVADGTGLTGLVPEGEVDLGTIEVPANLGEGPIMAGDDGDVPDGSLDPDSQARLDGNDVPVGVNSFGKGQDALFGDASGDGADGDRDGLVDLFDADDNGDGRVDDLEEGAAAWALPPGADVHAFFFMNLKINVENSDVYYHGTPEQIDDRLAVQTAITLECLSEPGAARTITGARLLPSPAPAYLPLTTIIGTDQLWSDTGYAFEPKSDRFGIFVVPNAVMEAGDTFTVEVSFNDGSSEQYSRMINYILKNIPKLVKYGPPGALQAYDPGSPATFGSQNDPVPFDGSQNLVLEFNPPVDETGTYLEGFEYGFHIFYGGGGGDWINSNDVDYDATFPTSIPGLNQGRYTVLASDPQLAALSADDTYTIELPKEVFPDQVIMNNATTRDVAEYQVDITAECPSGNSAIKIVFARQ